MSLALETPLAVSTAVVHGELCVTVHGELTVRTAWELRQAIVDASEGSIHTLVIDLSRVSTMDPAGLVAVSAAAMAMRRRRGAVSVMLPRSPTARRVVDLAGIGPLLGSAL